MYEGKYTNSNVVAKILLQNFYKTIFKIAQPINSELKRVLEVGCGHGYSTQHLSKIFGESTLEALDVDQKLVQDAKKKNPDIQIAIESIYNLNRDDEKFDLIILLEVLEHLSFPELALEELYRVTKKYCIISVPNEPLWRILNMVRGSYWREFGNTPGHVNHWSKSGITRLVGNYFKITTVVTVIPWTVLLVKK